MRKDVRFGLTIGAILLAVLVVYVLVVPADRAEQGVQLETLNPDGTVATPVDPAPEAQGEAVAQTTAGTQTTEPDAAAEPELTRTPIVQSDEQPDWHKILYGAAAVSTPEPASPAAPQERFLPQPPTMESSSALTSSADSASPGGTESPLPRDLPATPATYTVQSGDNLWTISKKVFGDGRYASEIQKANPGLNPNRLKIGQELKLPDRASLPSSSAAPATPAAEAAIDSGKQYRVQPGDSLHRIATRLYGSDVMWMDLYQLNRQAIGADPAKLKVGMVLQLPDSPNTATAGAR